jgi:hypothetical protein
VLATIGLMAAVVASRVACHVVVLLHLSFASFKHPELSQRIRTVVIALLVCVFGCCFLLVAISLQLERLTATTTTAAATTTAATTTTTPATTSSATRVVVLLLALIIVVVVVVAVVVVVDAAAAAVAAAGLPKVIFHVCIAIVVVSCSSVCLSP